MKTSPASSFRKRKTVFTTGFAALTAASFCLSPQLAYAENPPEPSEVLKENIAAGDKISLLDDSDHTANPGISADARTTAPTKFSLLQAGGKLEYQVDTGSGSPLGDGFIPVQDGTGAATPVKLQNPWGSCWSFGSIAASESAILSQLGLSYNNSDTRLPQKMDLSERHLAWFSGQQLHDGSSQDGEGIIPITANARPTDSDIYNLGGNSTLATTMMAQGIGPVWEEDAPYRNNAAIKAENGEGYAADGDWSLDYQLRDKHAFELQNGNLLPAIAGKNPEGVRAVKSELMRGSGVAIGFQADTSIPGENGNQVYYNAEHASHYDPTNRGTNHTVAIMGWDDNFPKEYFNQQPPGNGAWLVKNSWGSAAEEFPNESEWGAGGEGYFWLSFYDTTVARPESFEFDVERSLSGATYITRGYDNMPGLITSYGLNPKVFGSQANIFRNLNDDMVPMRLYAVSVETGKANTELEISLYMLDNAEKKNPANGELIGSFTDTVGYAGYHRINLPENSYVAIPYGKALGVVVKETASELNQQGNQEKMSQISLRWNLAEKSAREAELPKYGKAIVNKGESFVQLQGKWVDFTQVRSALADLVAYGGEQPPAGETGTDVVAIDNLPIRAYLNPIDPATVPDVTGLDETDALVRLNAAGFSVVAFEEMSTTVPEGHVIRQTPAGGEQAFPLLARGFNGDDPFAETREALDGLDPESPIIPDAVTLVVSSGTRTPSVPDDNTGSDDDEDDEDIPELQPGGNGSGADSSAASDDGATGGNKQQGASANNGSGSEGAGSTHAEGVAKQEATGAKNLAQTGAGGFLLIPAGVLLVAAGFLLFVTRRRRN